MKTILYPEDKIAKDTVSATLTVYTGIQNVETIPGTGNASLN
jgi:hypothetical protein